MQLISDRAIEKGGKGRGERHLLEQKKFFPQSENIKFLHVNNMWDFTLLNKT